MSKKLEERLADTQKELNELKAEYQEFVYVVSHDLNASLRQITGFSEIIANKYSETFEDKSRRHLALILSGSAKAKQLLDALTDYSRLNTRAECFTSINCEEIIEKVKQQLSERLNSRNAKIIFPALPVIIGDKTQIYQLFYHLIHNALHYQEPENKPKIEIEVTEQIHHWQFCIKDNGIGVPTNLTEKIFTVLRRAVSDKKFAGIGMGLAIAKKVLHRHHGEIWVDKHTKHGSSFYFTIAKELSNEL
jgi:light-regulated signal transduction histidine kinase (bacteriophytochrome)